ncbi:hypothetical protein ACVXZZ_17390 [Staphylococcus aureus]
MKLAEAIKEPEKIKKNSLEELANILKVSNKVFLNGPAGLLLRYFDCYERFIRNYL